MKQLQMYSRTYAFALLFVCFFFSSVAVAQTKHGSDSLPKKSTLPNTACTDNKDNDGDGFVDFRDPGCSDPTDRSEHCDDDEGMDLSLKKCVPCKYGKTKKDFCRRCPKGEVFDKKWKICRVQCADDEVYEKEWDMCKPKCKFGLNISTGKCRRCPKGKVFDNVWNRCRIRCAKDQLFEKEWNKCLPVCKPGQNPALLMCVSCPAGSAYDSNTGGCKELPACSNGLDDDGDGRIDSKDPGCANSDDTTETNPKGPACDNGVDDDGDGFADAKDPGCKGPRDDSEKDRNGPACDNGIDDDKDGSIDFPADKGCKSPGDKNETGKDRNACDNGTDDDGDGLVDMEDPGCKGPNDNSERDRKGPACDNGIDDDKDGNIDFPADKGCKSPKDKKETGKDRNACDNGVDDDADGLIDMADPGCTGPNDNSENNKKKNVCPAGKTPLAEEVTLFNGNPFQMILPNGIKIQKDSQDNKRGSGILNLGQAPIAFSQAGELCRKYGYSTVKFKGCASPFGDRDINGCYFDSPYNNHIREVISRDGFKLIALPAEVTNDKGERKHFAWISKLVCHKPFRKCQ